MLEQTQELSVFPGARKRLLNQSAVSMQTKNNWKFGHSDRNALSKTVKLQLLF